MYLHILNVNNFINYKSRSCKNTFKGNINEEKKNLLQVMFYFKISFISINENVTYEV